ncbi:MAG: hypothetical protein EU539_10285 [Promethearchaeota archaeon]|nr:MAG: hypothetical protein EU539_10285 [Candidatus Lokiarchaeota archaeon]
MEKSLLFKISSILALIFAATGAILILVTPWAYWWYDYRAGGWRYYGSGVVNIFSGVEGVFILFAALLLIICAIISLLTIIPGMIKNRIPIIISLILAFVVLIMIVIGAVITAAVLNSEGLYWEFGAGFYGGISGTLLTILFTLIMIFTMKKE